MRELQFTTEKEDIDEQAKGGRYNPALVLSFRYHNNDYRFTVGPGYDDDISLFASEHGPAAPNASNEFYVLARNYSLGYIGLEVFDATGDQISDVFIDGDNYLLQYDRMSQRRCLDTLLDYVY